ncbi:hypothetical protein EC991_001384 [Linnemannia zychae]|nr:hypothetical protein EC991_001384 [Linnemannia zychae]
MAPTADGRSLTLKAKKNIELERWFFVLTKMWAFQQLLQRTEEDLAAAAANATAATEAASAAAAAASANAAVTATAAARAEECSSRRESGGGGAVAAAAGGVGGGERESESYHKGAHHNHQQRNTWNKRQTAPPIATIVQESLMRYQIPLPRVSAFLPGGLDWPEHQHQQQYRNEKGEVVDDQGAVANGAIALSVEEKNARRDSGENIRNAYLRKNSLAVVDQYSSPAPLSSAVVVANHMNDNTTTTMTGGVGGAGGGSGTGCDGDMNHAPDGTLTRHGRGGSWTQEPSCSIPTTEVHTGSSASGLGLHPQQQPTIVWPAAGTMEPAKAAAIDMWRRSLMSPLVRANTVSSFHSDDPDNQALVPASAAKLYLSRNNSRRPSAVSEMLLGPGLDYCCDADVEEAEEEEEDPYHHYQQGPISPLDNSRPKYFFEQQQQLESPYQQPRLAIDSTSETDNIPLAVVRTIRQNSIGTMDFQNLGPLEVRHYTHDDVHIDDDDDDDDDDESGAHNHASNKMNAYASVKARRRQLTKVPEPSLLHVQQQQQHPRYSRWQKTQLSSEDETGTNRDSFAALTNTPDMSRYSYPTFLATNYNNNRDSYLNLQNSCADRERDGYSVDRDPYHSNNGYESNKESASLSDPTLNQHHLRVTAEPNLPRPSSSPFMSSAEFASVTGGGSPTMMPTRQSMAAIPVQVKSVPAVGILKRPSLPGMDTAALQAAVDASKAMQRQKTTSFQALPSFSNNSNGPIHPLARPSQPLPPSTSTPVMNSFGTASPQSASQGAPFRTAHASGLLPPPPTRPPRRHPIRTPVASDIKFSPSRRNSQDGSIISGFGGNTAANLAGISGVSDATVATATVSSPSSGDRKVEKSKSLLSFLTLNANSNTNNNGKNFSSPKSNTNDSSSPPAPTISPRRNSLPAVHFLGIGLSMMLAANNNNNNNTNGVASNPATTPPTAEIKKQRRSSILSLHRTLGNTDKSEKQELTATGTPRPYYEQAEILLRDPSPPQTPSPSTKSPTSNRRFSLPAAVLSPSSSSNSLSGYNGVGYNNGIMSGSTPSLLSSFPPTATRAGSAASSRPTSAYINTASNRLSASLSSGSLSRSRSRANSNASNNNPRNIGELNISQYQRQSYPLKLQTVPLIQVDAPAPTPIPEKEKEKEEKEKEQHKGYCRGKLNPDSAANGGGGGGGGSGGCGNGYNGRPLTCCSESELIEVLNTNSEEDDDFCYF